jgi:hypothetical protein
LGWFAAAAAPPPAISPNANQAPRSDFIIRD